MPGVLERRADIASAILSNTCLRRAQLYVTSQLQSRCQSCRISLVHEKNRSWYHHTVAPTRRKTVVGTEGQCKASVCWDRVGQDLLAGILLAAWDGSGVTKPALVLLGKGTTWCRRCDIPLPAAGPGLCQATQLPALLHAVFLHHHSITFQSIGVV